MDWGLVYSAALVGFLAQLVDGALGMAYGIISNSFLLSLGISPAVSSASIHIAEVFTTLTSGVCHFRLGNVDKKLLRCLVLPGVAAGIIGAASAAVIPGRIIKPFVTVYLIVMGVVLVNRVLRQKVVEKRIPTGSKWLGALGSVGGFFDAVGGGGWGPIVTSTLLGRGYHPRKVVGSVNLAEFFVTLAQSVTFIALLHTICWEVVLGLVMGGVVTAPLAAMVCRRMRPKLMMTTIASMLLVINLYRLFM